MTDGWQHRHYFFQLIFLGVLNYLLKQNVCRKITDYAELGDLVHLKDKEISRALGSVYSPEKRLHIQVCLILQFKSQV